MSAESDAATDAPTAQAHAPPASIDETPITQLSDRQMDRLGREDNAVLRTRFLAHFDFGAVPVVAALRQFLAACRLTGETQEMDRTLRAIATRFVECNPSAYATTRHATSVDTVHRLLYAVILLNTDLHSAGARDQRKMTRDEFIQNTRGNGDGEDALPVTEQELGAIYDSIRAKPLISLAALHVASQADEISENATGPTLSTAMPLQIPHDRSGSLVLRRFSFRRHPKPATAACSESRLAIVEPMLQGYLTRKHVLNNFHTKAVSRRWREFFAVLHGSDLYLYATSTEELAESEPMSPRTGDASAVAVAGGQQNVSASGKSLLSRDSLSRLLIRTPLAFHPLRHALASPLPPRGYSPTRQHVFQLMLPNEELFLFQTHTHLEKIRWVTAINWWASRESHEPMPMAIGSGVFGFERFWLMGFVSGGVEELDREEEAAHMRRMNTGTQQTTADDAEMTVPSMDAPPFAPVRLAETVQESSLIDWVAPTLPFVPNSRRGKVDEATLLGKTSALRDAPIGVDELSLPTIDRQRVLWISRIKSLKEDMGAHLMAREILKHFGIGGGIQELVLAEQRRALQRKSLTTAPRPMSRLTAVSNDHEKVSCVTSFDSMHLDAVTTKPSSRPAGESQDHVDEMSIATSRSMDDRSSPSTIVTNMASNAGSDRPAKPNRLRRRNSTIVASSSANSISPLSPLSTSSTPPLFSGTHMQSHSRSTLSRASWSPFFNDSSFSVNSVANTMHLDNEEDGQFWRASHVIKVAGATMLKVNHHEMDEHAEPGPASSAAAELPAASDKKRLLATIRLPSPSYALVDIPNLPSCLITCIASPTATLQLPDFPRANRKMAARIEQNWIRRFRHLQWELCKTQSYLDVLGDNPMTWTLALDTSPVPESSTQKPGRPPLFPY